MLSDLIPLNVLHHFVDLYTYIHDETLLVIRLFVIILIITLFLFIIILYDKKVFDIIN